jgi:hypothetical protein
VGRKKSLLLCLEGKKQTTDHFQKGSTILLRVWEGRWKRSKCLFLEISFFFFNVLGIDPRPHTC